MAGACGVPVEDSALEADTVALPSDPEQDRSRSLVPMSPLRPVYFDLAVINAHVAAAGGELAGLTVDLDLPEMGAVGTAVVTDVLPGPVIEAQSNRQDRRQVVTATFRHPPSETVLDVTFADSLSAASRGQSSEPMGVTNNHPFWSVDRQEFTPIGEMVVGERIQTYHGETKCIVSKLPRPGPSEVYNLEVYGEHVYYVGQSATLVHNTCSTAKSKGKGAQEAYGTGWARVFGAPTRNVARYGGAQQRQALLNQVSASGTLSEAKGVVHSFREMKRLGYELQDVSLHYRGNPGLDLIFHNGSRYAVVEAKYGKYLSPLKTYKGGLRQGSLDYNISRLERYIQYGDGTHNTLTNQLLNEAYSGQLESSELSTVVGGCLSCRLAGRMFLRFLGNLNYGIDNI